MKSKLKELDVDFIGGQQQPITKEEELAISDFIRRQKTKKQLQAISRTKIKSTKKVHLRINFWKVPKLSKSCT